MAYALVALGFVLALNAAGAVNFAHGDLVVLGGAVAVLAGVWTGLPGLLLLPLVALALGARGHHRRTRRDPAAGRDGRPRRPSSPPSRSPPSSSTASPSTWGQRRAPRRRWPAAVRSTSPAWCLAASRSPSSWSARVLVAAVWFLLERTQTGRRMRAVAADRYMARAVGIPVGRYVTLSLALAGALAGVAGFLLGHQFLVAPTQGAGHMLQGLHRRGAGRLGQRAGRAPGSAGHRRLRDLRVGRLWRRLGVGRALYRRSGGPGVSTAGPVRRAGRPARLRCARP